jgi:hypothetical protein
MRCHARGGAPLVRGLLVPLVRGPAAFCRGDDETTMPHH